jgi:hypothetical protein
MKRNSKFNHLITILTFYTFRISFPLPTPGMLPSSPLSMMSRVPKASLELDPLLILLLNSPLGISLPNQPTSFKPAWDQPLGRKSRKNLWKLSLNDRLCFEKSLGICFQPRYTFLLSFPIPILTSCAPFAKLVMTLWSLSCLTAFARVVWWESFWPQLSSSGHLFHDNPDQRNSEPEITACHPISWASSFPDFCCCYLWLALVLPKQDHHDNSLPVALSLARSVKKISLEHL